ncbi:MAG: HEAT repeat domain-containing protein [Dehalococcoidia bacterium]|nr:HEAT repeat domain-containing protein [Dehalococcoidia bacterium]
MTAESPPHKQCIAEIFDSNKPLVNSKLAYLSDLTGEGLDFLKEVWTKAHAERRRQVISHLVHLSEADLRLDFSSTFVFGLGDPDEAVRTQAIAGLEPEENHRFIRPLLRALKQDTSTEVRAAAAIALGRFALLGELDRLSTYHTDKVYTALLEVLDNEAEPVEVKRRALEAIAPLSLPRVKESIQRIYHSNDVKLKASAVYAMGRNCDTAWLTVLLTELTSPEAEMRYEAANACGELGADEAVPHLIMLTKDEDGQIQEAAIKALGEIGGDEAKQTLSELAEDPEPGGRQAARSALKELHFWEDPLPSKP